MKRDPGANVSPVMPERLNTSRLHLRLPLAEDAESLPPTLGDPAVMQWVGRGLPLDSAGIAAAVTGSIALWRRQGLGLYTVAEREGGAVVGRAGLGARDPESWARIRRGPVSSAALELGVLFRRSVWGQGYAREALSAVAQLAWQLPWKPQSLVYLSRRENHAAIRLAAAMGMLQTGEAELDGLVWQVYELRRPPNATTRRATR